MFSTCPRHFDNTTARSTSNHRPLNFSVILGAARVSHVLFIPILKRCEMWFRLLRVKTGVDLNFDPVLIYGVALKNCTEQITRHFLVFKMIQTTLCSALSTWHCPHLLPCAVLRPSAAAPLLLGARRGETGISCPPGAQQQTRRTPLLRSNDGTDRQTHARLFHRLCSAYSVQVVPVSTVPVAVVFQQTINESSANALVSALQSCRRSIRRCSRCRRNRNYRHWTDACLCYLSPLLWQPHRQRSSAEYMIVDTLYNCHKHRRKNVTNVGEKNKNVKNGGK